MMKISSFSSKMRQSLSDITNSQSQETQTKITRVKELNSLQECGTERSRNVNRITKENVELIKLLEERDKTIEASRYELRYLREGMHKLQVQNWNLAQTNTQYIAEINLARNKVKALQHEVSCKNALLKAKCCREEEGIPQPKNVQTNENVRKSTNEEFEKPSLPNRRRFIKSKFYSTALGAYAAHNIDVENQKSEIKRTQLRRKSTRVRRTTKQEVTESLFEIEDLQLAMPNDTCQQENLTTASHTQKEEEDFRRRDVFTRPRDPKAGRSPVNRLVL